MTVVVPTYLYPRAANTSSIICWAWIKDAAELRRGIEVLGIRRGRAPFKGLLALPGGFHDVDQQEDLEHTAVRELLEETRIEVLASDLRLVLVQSSPVRDPREHVIDHVYHVEVPREILNRAQAADDAASIEYLQILKHEDVPSGWAFDHSDSLARFINRFEWDRIGISRYRYYF